MLDLSSRVVGAYAAVSFPLALFCAIPLFDHPGTLSDAAEARYLRRARVLLILAPLHVLMPITALGMTRDARRLALDPETRDQQRRRLRAGAIAGVAVAVVTFVLVAGAAS